MNIFKFLPLTFLIVSSYINPAYSLTLKEKIGQLFVATVCLDPNCIIKYPITPQYAKKLITDYAIGGIIFLGKNLDPEKQNAVINDLQLCSKHFLLVAQDLENGLAMRLADTISYPYFAELDKISNNTLIRELGYNIGKQCALIGVNWNLSPVADCFTNPCNTVIGKRSFGADPLYVAQKSIAFAQGLTDAGILSCAKHFPGHGDTLADSHHELPVILHDKARLWAVELYPFKELIAQDIPAIMIGHLAVPALEPDGTPATLSKTIVTNLLINELNYKGLIVTDALDMKAITNQYSPGQAALMALKAGCDVLLCSPDIPGAIEYIHEAILSGELHENQIDLHLAKIHQAKDWIIKNQHLNQSIDKHKSLVASLNDASFLTIKNLLEAQIQALNG